MFDRTVHIRVYQSEQGCVLVITGAERKGRETRIKLTYSEADELAQALGQRLIARIPSETGSAPS